MAQRLQKGNRFIVASALVLSSLCSLLTLSSAKAATVYDDAIQLTSSATLMSPDGTDTKNISTSWLSEIDAITTSACDAAVAEILALDYEAGHMLGVTTFNNSNDGFERGVYIYWQTEGGQLGFRTDGSLHRLMGYSGANITTGSTGTGNSGSAVLFINNSGLVHGSCDSSAFMLSENAISTNIPDGEKIFFTNWPINYPSGYGGNSVPSSNQGGVIRGNVQCANSSNVISAIGINVQSGVDGGATITDDGMGGKNYHFNLTEESPYSLVVICDGDSFYGPTVNANYYNIYSWACATTGGLNVCAAA